MGRLFGLFDGAVRRAVRWWVGLIRDEKTQDRRRREQEEAPPPLSAAEAEEHRRRVLEL